MSITNALHSDVLQVSHWVAVKQIQRNDKVFHQPANTLLESSEARNITARQQEETRRPRRERNPLDTSAHFLRVPL